MLKSLKITCDEATAICDKNQYGEASIKELVKLNLHFFGCKICSVYSKQNITLSKLYKGYSSSCKDMKHCMSEEDKQKLKEALEKGE